VVTSEVALGALELLEIDACDFDKTDRAILSAIIDKCDGGPVGAETLPATVGEESDTIGDVCELYILVGRIHLSDGAGASPHNGHIRISTKHAAECWL
jgi:Holliday junction resolvasome RuvABC ATP-dependent DNA helicase subunit